eukprot:Hpha_TRINITY_DN16676_c1_g2::TRINITY_DN16676_c1_g2_i1::g.182825::m.182825
MPRASGVKHRSSQYLQTLSKEEQLRALHRMQDDEISSDDSGPAVPTAGRLYDECLMVDGDQWFSLRDCCYRYSLTVALYYWALLTTPFSLLKYLFKYCMLWYGPAGVLLWATFPVLPIGVAVLTGIKKVQSLFKPDWSMAGPGRVFFMKPDNPIGAFVWDCYLCQSMMVCQFYLVGTNSDAISHTWCDILLTKDFWRSVLGQEKARCPLELGRWNNGSMEWKHELKTRDVVVKIPDSYLGIGDAFWNHGKDYNSRNDLEEMLKEQYSGKEAMILEFCRPDKELGVHSLDIVTLRNGDDVRVLSVLLWCDCETSSSHSCRAGYIVDVETEKIVGPARWYSPYFAKQATPLVGQTLKGVRQAALKAVDAHRAIEYKWLTAVGWDCMINNESDIVFFEGNFAGARTPRRIFLNWSCLYEFVSSWAWPFGKSMRPS